MLQRLLGVVLLLMLGGPTWILQAQDQAPRNVILFISDGTGPASFTMARDYLRAQHGVSELALDSVQVGAIHTYATDSRVTDSAAGATAFASGVKTYNGAIGVDTLQRPVATLLEAAEARGMATGLVATSSITHATPAAFAAHVPNRSMEVEIAAQEIEQGVEVMLGGGRQFFLPESEDGRREDGRNLLQEVDERGVHVVTDRAGFDALAQTPALGLFAMGHLDYEIDRDAAEQPSLAEMTAKAIDLLDDDPEGFFLMVEGSRIDHAGHGNDAAAHLHDLLAYNEAVATALAFAREDGNTLIVSTSDHETGGLTLGRNIDGNGVYAWYPEVLAGVQASHWPIIEALMDEQPVKQVMRDLAGIDDLSFDEQAMLVANLGDSDALNYALGEVIARRAVLAWTSRGHTAVDVGVYAYGPGSEGFMGNQDNTAIGRGLEHLLGFDLDAMTDVMQDAVVGESR